jgi:hypothetical protein
MDFPPVSIQVRLLREAFSAIFADEGSFPRMHAKVIKEEVPLAHNDVTMGVLTNEQVTISTGVLVQILLYQKLTTLRFNHLPVL